MITGHCRARLHKLEHTYGALHTSTDSILTQVRTIRSGTALGDLEIRARGTLLLFRTKLCVLLSEEGLGLKKALQGFHSDVNDLLELNRRAGDGRYAAPHLVHLREAQRMGAGLAESGPLAPCELQPAAVQDTTSCRLKEVVYPSSSGDTSGLQVRQLWLRFVKPSSPRAHSAPKISCSILFLDISSPLSPRRTRSARPGSSAATVTSTATGAGTCLRARASCRRSSSWTAR
jgi:hypothetical protein